MAQQIFPLEVWTSQITQASVPANNNSLRVEVLQKPALGFLSSPPGNAVNGDIYIVGASPTGGWSTFLQGDVVILEGGTWLAYAPFEGWVKTVTGVIYVYTSGAWIVLTLPSAPVPPPAVESVTASETLALSRAGKFLQCDHATTAIVITVPDNAAVAFDIGTEIHLRQSGAAVVSVAPATGVTITKPASQTLVVGAQYGVVTLKKVAADSWALFGFLGASA